jgi:N-formylmaleamate deformylase
MTNWKDGYVDVNGNKIHYYRTGGDKPQVVLNHGVMDDGLCWTRVAKELESDYDVIMLDARGHGFSDDGNGDYKSETRANDVAEVVKSLGLEKPVVGGHSLGAEVSIHFAANYPDIPRALFLEDPPIAMPGEPMFGGRIGEMGEGALKMMATIMKLIKILPIFLGKIIAKKMMPNSPDDEIIPWLNSKKRFSSDLLKSMAEEPEALVPSPFEAVKKVKVPTLLFMGDREKGSIVSVEVAEKMKTLIPDLQVFHLEGANHDIRRSKFDEYMTALKTFLAQVYS